MGTLLSNSGKQMADQEDKPEPTTCEKCGRTLDWFQVDLLGRKKWIMKTCECIKAEWEKEEKRRKAEERRRRIERLFSLSRLGTRFMESRFENWEPMPGAEAALDYALDFAENFEEYQKRGEGLLIYGPPGNGKSHLAAAVVHRLLERGKPAIFQSVPDLLDRIRRTYDRDNSTNEGQIMAALEEADLLVLDDAGAEQWTEWAESKLYTIIDHRYRNKKPIFVTTNTDVEELESAVGFRAYDRLLEMCLLVKNSGESYRRIIARRRIQSIKEGRRK